MKKNFILATMACVSLMAASAGANTITYVTPTGATTSGPVDASATFTTGAGTVSITLNNLEANPTDVAQLLSDLSFTLTGNNLGSGTLGSSSGQEISISSHAGTTGSSVAAGWILSSSGNTFTLNVLAAGGAGPTHLIIGPGPYSNANGSINGNGPHNPFLNLSATFIVDITGVTVDTTVTGVTFSFGTTAGIDVTGQPPTTVPDGGTTVLLLGAALSGLGMLRRKLS